MLSWWTSPASPQYRWGRDFPQCKWYRDSPQYTWGRGHPQCKWHRDNPPCIWVRDHPQCTWRRGRPQCKWGRDHPRCKWGRDSPQCTWRRDNLTCRWDWALQVKLYCKAPCFRTITFGSLRTVFGPIILSHNISMNQDIWVPLDSLHWFPANRTRQISRACY